MNYFAPAALACRAMVGRVGAAPSTSTTSGELLHQDVRFLSRLFKREFVYRAEYSYERQLDETLATLAIRGLIDVHDDGSVAVRDAEPVALLAGLLDCFVEAYWVVACTLQELRKFPLWKKELVTRAMERARRCFFEGQIQRPESSGRTLTENALGWMLATGVIEPHASGKKQELQLSEAYENQGLQQLINDIGAFL